MDEEIKEIKLDEKTSEVKPELKFFVNKNISLKIFGIFLVFFLALGIIVGIPVYKLIGDSKILYSQLIAVKDVAKTQDLQKIKTSIDPIKKQVAIVKNDANLIGWTKYIPYFGGYTNDLLGGISAGQAGIEAGEILVEAIEPYSDILGLKGQGTFTGGTAEDRIAKVVETLDKVTPQINAVAQKVDVIRRNVDEIDANRYPEKYRAQIVSTKETVDFIDSFLSQAQPMVKKLPELLGSKTEQRYMVLFQNDAELRPTGGFITAYAIFRVHKGKINLEASDDIYKLDDTMTKHVVPPAPIAKHLMVYGWRMRDANFSPDFLSSMKTFEDLYATSSQKQDIEGIITMDTKVLVAMLDALGPISIYGTNFTTQNDSSCGSPMVICELEKYADEPKSYMRGSRKDIIGVLLTEMMRKAMGSGRTVYSKLFAATMDMAVQKHILMYFKDTDAQKGVEALNFAGRIKTYSGDYLHVNDANLAGAKSNLYIVPSVKQDVTITDAGAETNLTLTYKYPHNADNCSLERVSGLCLAGIYRDYLRVYFPKGAEVLEVRGFEQKGTTYEDLDHTTLDGFFTVVPQGLATIQIKYKVAGDFKKKGEYRELIQKQPGTDKNHYQVTVNGKVNSFDLLEDKELVVKL